MKIIIVSGGFDPIHSGHIAYFNSAKSLGDKLVVVVAHDETVRKRKHEPITNHNLRRRMVSGLKPVDSSLIGNPPEVPIFEILSEVRPHKIALGYDQKHSIDSIKKGLIEHGFGDIEVLRVEGLSDDLDGTRKIIAKILDIWPNDMGGPYEED